MVKLLSLIAALLDITDSFNMLSPCPTTISVRPCRRKNQRITYQDLIQIGLLICAIVALYNNKKK